MAIPSFLKLSGDSYVFTQEGEFVFYVPEVYFETHNAEINGEIVSVLGILDYAVFDKSGKHSGLKQFKFPSVIQTKPDSIEKVKGVVLTKNHGSADYRLLKYKKDGIVIISNKYPKDIVNVENFFRMFFMAGKIPKSIPYNEIHDIILEACTLNDVKIPVTTQLFGVAVSELCRSSKDLSIPFRLAKDNDMKNYSTLSVNQVPKYASSFSAITSENWDEAVLNAIINDKDTYNPLEKILMK